MDLSIFRNVNKILKSILNPDGFLSVMEPSWKHTMTPVFYYLLLML